MPVLFTKTIAFKGQQFYMNKTNKYIIDLVRFYFEYLTSKTAKTF